MSKSGQTPMSTVEAVAVLRDPATIRSRAHFLLERAQAGESKHFFIDNTALERCANEVLQVTRHNYPTLQVPFHSRWRHFEVAGTDRFGGWRTQFEQQYRGTDCNRELCRIGVELAIVSVLLDAGTGPNWRFKENTANGIGVEFSRSEGLAVASWTMFVQGAFANDRVSARADSEALLAFTAQRLKKGFQVTPNNPLVGVAQRASLVAKLGTLYPNRLGQIADELIELAKPQRPGEQPILRAKQVLGVILERLAPIWPLRLSLSGINLGDVWRHRALEFSDPTAGLMPFHKLSQWLAYSLMEPLQWAGIHIVDLDALTGLPEYRNGGLLIDWQVIQCRDPAALGSTWEVSDEFIVEWRALTVALLDKIGDLVRNALNCDAQALPLVKILQGGTWQAGRLVAAQKRKGGGPPLTIQSDGTVF
jgi:Protein of unknown function (DUF1688)